MLLLAVWQGLCPLFGWLPSAERVPRTPLVPDRYISLRSANKLIHPPPLQCPPGHPLILPGITGTMIPAADLTLRSDSGLRGPGRFFWVLCRCTRGHPRTPVPDNPTGILSGAQANTPPPPRAVAAQRVPLTVSQRLSHLFSRNTPPPP